MKTINFLKTLFVFILAFSFPKIAFTQSTVTPNNTAGTGYLGWDGSMAVPLDIVTTNSFNIDFYTGSVLRMNLMGNALYNDGYLGIDLTNPRFRLDVNNNIG